MELAGELPLYEVSCVKYIDIELIFRRSVPLHYVIDRFKDKYRKYLAYAILVSVIKQWSPEDVLATGKNCHVLVSLCNTKYACFLCYKLVRSYTYVTSVILAEVKREKILKRVDIVRSM